MSKGIHMSNKLSTNTFKKKTGIQNIQEYLESGRSITALEALSNFGIFRLASAIEVLRKRGMNIETDLKEDPNGKTYARYTLVEAVNAVEAKKELKVGARVRSLHPLGGGLLGEVKSLNHGGAFGSRFPILVLQDGGAEGIYAVNELEVI
jgi:hypothetical protein